MTRKYYKLRSDLYLFSIIILVTLSLTGCLGTSGASNGGSSAISSGTSYASMSKYGREHSDGKQCCKGQQNNNHQQYNRRHHRHHHNNVIPTIPLTINGSVYDSGIAGATVDLVIGNAVVATTIADINGKYTISYDTTRAERRKPAIIRAYRGAIKLQSLLGILQTAVDARDSSGAISQSNYPKVVVTNVTTALTAVIKNQNGCSLPKSQSAIDRIVKYIANDPTKQSLVTKIAAAIKAVVDYDADPTSVSGSVYDTQALADYLANNSSNIDTNLDTLVATASSAVTANELINVVQSDPNTGTQLPYAIHAADLIGKYYAIGDNSMFYFQDSSTLLIYNYDAVISGEPDVITTWSLSNNTITIPIEPDTAILKITSGTPDAIYTDATFQGVTFNVALLHVEPIGGGNIGASDITNKLIVDPQSNVSIKFPANCNGSDTGWFNYDGIVLPATCNISIGMIIVSPDWAAAQLGDGGNFVIGLLSNSWNGSKITQAFNTVIWQRGTEVTYYDKVYAGTDIGSNPCINCPAGTDSYPIAVFNYTGGKVQLRLLKKDYTDVNNPGELVIYDSTSTTPTEKYFWPAQGVANWPNKVSLAANDVSGTSGPRLVTSLGTHAGSQLRAVYTVDNLTNNNPLNMVTRSQYNLEQFSASDVSGKTFHFSDMNNTGFNGTITFNENGTADMVSTGGTASFQWSIGTDASTNAAFGSTGVMYNNALVLSDSNGNSNIFYRTKDLGGGTYITANYGIDSVGNVTGVATVQLNEQ